jgi:hypothetical protein
MEMWELQEKINHKSFYRMFSLGKENQYGQRNLTLAKSFILKTTKNIMCFKRGHFNNIKCFHANHGKFQSQTKLLNGIL